MTTGHGRPKTASLVQLSQLVGTACTSRITTYCIPLLITGPKTNSVEKMQELRTAGVNVGQSYLLTEQDPAHLADMTVIPT